MSVCLRITDRSGWQVMLSRGMTLEADALLPKKRTHQHCQTTSHIKLQSSSCFQNSCIILALISSHAESALLIAKVAAAIKLMTAFSADGNEDHASVGWKLSSAAML